MKVEILNIQKANSCPCTRGCRILGEIYELCRKHKDVTFRKIPILLSAQRLHVYR